jgi:8-oxo-dGTP pyrophosphatase MutT (NUDIX family)
MELWDAYDKHGVRQPGILVRGEPIPPGLYHLVSCIVVRHEDGDFLLMKRSPVKEHYPNIWEIGAGGSVVRGETAEESARRELEEETGISRGQWAHLGRYVEYDTIYEGYLCVTDWPKDAVRLQEGETVDYRWLTREEFIAFFDSDQCIERFKKRLRDYVNSLRR